MHVSVCLFIYFFNCCMLSRTGLVYCKKLTNGLITTCWHAQPHTQAQLWKPFDFVRDCVAQQHKLLLCFFFLHTLASVAAIVFCDHHLTQAFCLIALLSLCFLVFFLPSISADPSISVLFCSEPRFAFALIIFSVIVIITVLLMCPSRVSNCIFRQAFASRQSLNLLCSQKHSNLVQTSDF